VSDLGLSSSGYLVDWKLQTENPSLLGRV